MHIVVGITDYDCGMSPEIENNIISLSLRLNQPVKAVV